MATLLGIQFQEQNMQVTIGEAAHRLRVSEHTVRRRVRNGELPGIQVATPQGFTWRVEIETEAVQEPPIVDGKELALAALEARIDSLESQLLSKDEQLGVAANQIGELHRLLAQSALSAGQRPWWRFW